MDEKRQYDLFTLTISAENTIQATLNTYNNFETRAPDPMGPTARVDESQSLREDIERGILELKKGELDGRQDDIQRLGRNMYQAVFPGEIGDFFEQALQTVMNDRQGENSNRWLRVIINVHPKSVVFDWPLEFLYCQKHDQWLATARPFMALSRRIEFGGIVDLNRQRPPLRALIVISKPKGLAGVITTKVLEEIGKVAVTNSTGEEGNEEKQMEIQVLGKLEKYERISGIENLDQPAQYGEIKEVIEIWRPHVFHFIGHGQFESELQGGSLGLVNAEDEVDWCSSDNVSQIFASWRPRLVLLQACEGAMSGTEPGFMSLAQRLFKRNIPAVVAMQFAITNDYATLFAKGFYEALRDGQDVDYAVQIGRSKIVNQVRWKKRDFGVPVLFTYKPDGIIQPLSSRPSKFASQPSSQSMVLGKSGISISQQARDSIDKALVWLGDRGENVNVDMARIWMKRVLNFHDEQILGAKLIIEDALRFLDDDEKENAIQCLYQALKALEQPAITGPKKGF